MGWVVNTTLRPLYPLEKPGTHCIGGWVSPMASLDWCGIFRPPPGFDHRTAQPVASRYTDYAMPAPLRWVGVVFITDVSKEHTFFHFQMLRNSGDSLTLSHSVSTQKTRILNIRDLEKSNLPKLPLFIIVISYNKLQNVVHEHRSLQ